MPDSHTPPAGAAQPPEFDAGLMWFRRDLRCDDNTALLHALRHCRKVYCVYVFDNVQLDPLPRSDRRVEFVRESLVALDVGLRTLAQAQQAPDAAATGLIALQGHAPVAIAQLAGQLGVQAVFAAREYEPDTVARDNLVRGALAETGVSLRLVKDHVVFAHGEILSASGQPHTAFAPYLRDWLTNLSSDVLRPRPSESAAVRLAPRPESWRNASIPALEALDFLPTNLASLPIQPGCVGADAAWGAFFERINHYHQTLGSTLAHQEDSSLLGIHLRFGTLSVRRVARMALILQQQGNQGAGKWLEALARRDFFAQLLALHSHTATAPLKPMPQAARLDHGAHGKKLFAAWCHGQTGYPLLDAAMRQLHASGAMPHRLRLLAASFLTRQLGVDWRWGERHFAEHLNDYDLASNVGNWQYAAGCGGDAPPWQQGLDMAAESARYDPDGNFIRRHLPELATLPDADIHAPWLAEPEVLAAAGVSLGHSYPPPATP